MMYEGRRRRRRRRRRKEGCDDTHRNRDKQPPPSMAAKIGKVDKENEKRGVGRKGGERVHANAEKLIGLGQTQQNKKRKKKRIQTNPLP